MDPLLIALAGTALTLVALVGLRLPAFLALILGGLLVSLLTPPAVRQREALRGKARPWTAETPAPPGIVAGPVILFTGLETTPQPVSTGLLVPATGEPGAPLRLEPPVDDGPGRWIVPAADWRAARQAADRHPMAALAAGFAAVCERIGLLILFAALIGACLTRSGAAAQTVAVIRRRLGDRHAAAGLAAGSFTLGIPVFFDTVFYLLMPLGRQLAARTGRDFLLFTLSIVAGATMAHSLVPPTPGPLFAAGAFGVPLAHMMAGGLVVGLASVAVGWAYARWANARWPLPLRDLEALPAAPDAPSTPARLPPTWLALLPVVLPLGLIATRELLPLFPAARVPAPLAAALRFGGEAQMALLAGTVAGLLVLARGEGWRWRGLREPLAAAVTGGGGILLITAAGGAFGAVLKQTDIAARLALVSGGGGWTLLFAAFLVTAAVRVAQGSATVAMITAAGVVAPLALAAPLPYHPVYLALAVGCGSKPVPWLNDSGFWIISRMSGMTELETLRSASVMMSLMGGAGFGVVLLGAWLLPLAPG